MSVAGQDMGQVCDELAFCEVLPVGEFLRAKVERGLDIEQCLSVPCTILPH